MTPGPYIDDVPYIHTAYREVSPIWLQAILAALGERPLPTRGLRICDLGCGTGFSAAVTAAMLPTSTICAYDASVGHIAHGKGLVEEAGLSNLVFEAADIRELAGRPGIDASFDLVIVHGVLSWVAPNVREAIFAFIGRALAPNGVAYLHYAAHPGAAVLGSLQKALSLAGTMGDRSDKRAMEGLRLVEGLRKGAGLFIAHPQAARSFDQLEAEDPAYVAHEFMGPHWMPLHSADVIARMAQAGCRFAGSATPEENIDGLSLPTETLATIRSATSVFLRETLKDIARDQSLRRDIYVRSPRPLSPDDHLRALRTLTFRISARAPRCGPLVFSTRIGPVQGSAKTFDPILSELHEGPASFIRLQDLPAFQGLPGDLNQALTMLLSAGLVEPVLPEMQKGRRQRFERIVQNRRDRGENYPKTPFGFVVSRHL